jgi:hypothetical protein
LHLDMNRFLVAAVLICACAQAPARPPRAPPGSASLPHASLPPPSSIVAVLAHRGELALDDKQVGQLMDIQKQLDRENAEAQEGLAPRAERRASRQGAGGQDRPARQRGGPGGNRGGSETRHPASTDRDEALAESLGNNDAQAFLLAEPVFTASQWERARVIAEKYRVDYSDRREAARRPAAEPGNPNP